MDHGDLCTTSPPSPGFPASNGNEDFVLPLSGRRVEFYKISRHDEKEKHCEAKSWSKVVLRLRYAQERHLHGEKVYGRPKHIYSVYRKNAG